MKFSLDDDRTVAYGFAMGDGTGDKLASMFEDEASLDAFDDFRSDLEGYGVHDVCGHPNPAVESVAFTSYEVAEDKIPELMEHWRNYFISKYGKDVVGPITDVSSIWDADDLEIYSACIEGTTL
jgi:hypothetical protein